MENDQAGRSSKQLLTRTGGLGKGGLPSQVIEMNENVRELVIDA